jgi:hypothetical protein
MYTFFKITSKGDIFILVRQSLGRENIIPRALIIFNTLKMEFLSIIVVDGKNLFFFILIY